MVDEKKRKHYGTKTARTRHQPKTDSKPLTAARTSNREKSGRLRQEYNNIFIIIFICRK
jgi:hypothetical protein